MSKYPFLTQLLDKINNQFNLDLNSFLVSYMDNGRCTLRLHDDNEQELDHTQPIVVFTLGACRSIDFLNKCQESTETPALTLDPKEGSIYFMEPGCQTWFKHRVPRKQTPCGHRFSISFRKIVTASTPNGKNNIVPSPSSPTNAKSNIVPPPPSQTPSPSTRDCVTTVDSPRSSQHSSCQPVDHVKDYTVLFGTSITTRIKSHQVAGPNSNFINVSKSGAHISTISDMVENFHLSSQYSNRVGKIILSFGTNEIKYESKGVLKYEQSVRQLFRKVISLFPKAQIFVQSVLPTRNIYWYCSDNYHIFNNILAAGCQQFGFTFIDCGHEFMAKEVRHARGGEQYVFWDHNIHLFWDHMHLNNRGLEVLCRWFRSIIQYNTYGMKVIYYACS